MCLPLPGCGDWLRFVLQQPQAPRQLQRGVAGSRGVDACTEEAIQAWVAQPIGIDVRHRRDQDAKMESFAN